MRELLDPKSQNRILDDELSEAIKDVTLSFNQQKDEVRKRANNIRSQIESDILDKSKINVGSYCKGGGVAGAIAGLFICASTSNRNDFEAVMLIWLGLIAGGGIILAIIAYCMKDTGRLEGQKQAATDEECDQIKKLNTACEAQISQLRAECAQKKTKHLEEFSNLQREASVQYVGSVVAQEITDFIRSPFKKAIESSDRRPHIEQIEIPLCFEVCMDKVISPYGIYDFTIQRVQVLKGMKEIAALANAIATQIHTEVIADYPIDPSGGEVAPMKIDYEYRNESVKASMTYHAKNANYVEARSL